MSIRRAHPLDGPGLPIAVTIAASAATLGLAYAREILTALLHLP